MRGVTGGGFGDHPRTRGVYGITVPSGAEDPGSSPHARGLPGPRHRHSAGGRIIPARAGFTGMIPDRPSKRGDHPRTRGVYIVTIPSGTDCTGSSPHARGLPGLYPPFDHVWGIIPARAGFTHHRVPSSEGRGDHPRTRGVYYYYARFPGDPQGSSPHARGLPLYQPTLGFLNRIIPARAGFTPLVPHRLSSRPDHPRTRGVYPAFAVVGDGVGGSSPHARGLPTGWPVASVVTGIIPARAGFTACPYAIPYARGDHPRTRGVY